MTTVRPATHADADDMGRVMVESWLSAHRGQVPDDVWERRAAEWTPEVSADGWRRTLADQEAVPSPDAVLLVATDEHDQVCGLACARPLGDGVVELSALYVATGHRRRGAGAALLRSLAAALEPGTAALRLEVLVANHPARRFYEAMGATEVGRGTTDEDGHELPVAIYEWTGLAVLAGYG